MCLNCENAGARVLDDKKTYSILVSTARVRSGPRRLMKSVGPTSVVQVMGMPPMGEGGHVCMGNKEEGRRASKARTKTRMT